MIGLALSAFAVEPTVFSERDDVQEVVRVGDTDADGYDDLVVRQVIDGTTTRVVWVPGSAGGPDQSRARVLQGAPSRPGELRGLVASAGDHDGDGYDDVAAVQNGPDGGTVMVFRGGPDGLAARPWRSTTTLHAWKIGHLGDLNGDGLGEFGVSTSKGILVYRGGSARLVHHTLVATPGQALDFASYNNRDGLTGDLLVVRDPGGHTQHEVYVIPRTGTWTWGAAVRVDTLRSRFLFAPPIATDGAQAVVFMNGLDYNPISQRTESVGAYWHATALGLFRTNQFSCSIRACGTDVAIFDIGAEPRVVTSAPGGITLFDPLTGPTIDLGVDMGSQIENAGDVDGDGLDDLVGWSPEFSSWSFVSGAELDLE